MTITLQTTLAMGFTVAANVALAIVDELREGALEGIVIGILVGAIVMPMVQAPDTMLRTAFFAIMAAVGMSVYQLARIGQATGAEMGTILSAFSGPYTDAVGAMMREGIIWVLYSMLAGALIGAVSLVPDKVIKGGIVGLFMGVAVGAGLRVVFFELNVTLTPILLRIMIAALTWALFTVVVGGSDE
jgi:hypothetical protein